MKKNKLTLLAVTLMTALAFSACSSESVVENAPDVNVNPSAATNSKIVFNFSFPVTDSRMVFTRSTTSQDDTEAALKSLWMYEFEARGGALIQATDIFSSLTPGSNYTYTYTQTSGFTDNRARRFIFIANDAAQRTGVDNISKLIGTSTEEVEKKLTAGTIAAPTANSGIWQTIDGTDVLPMTGEAVRNGNNIIAIDSTGLAQTVNVDMTRVVARIDVRNYTPGLTITGLKLIKANGTSYIYPHLDTNGSLDIFSQTKIDNIGTYATIPPVVAGTSDGFTNTYNATGSSGDSGYDANEAGFLRKAFYVYEDSTATAADRLTLQVQGYIGNVNVFYNIPFSKAIALKDGTDKTWTEAYNADNSDTEAEAKKDEAVSVKRNHIYTVWVGDGHEVSIHTAVRATIKVKDWDTQEVNETFDPDLFVYTGTLTSASNDAKTAANTATGVWYHTSSQILDVPYTAISTNGNLKISVSPNYSNVAITGVDVLKENTTDSEDWLTATPASGDDTGKYFTITTTQNQKKNTSDPTTYDDAQATTLRSRSIKVTYTITPTGEAAQTYYTVFTVRQAAYTPEP